MKHKRSLIVIGGMASLILSGCAQLVPPHHPQLPLSPGALDGRVRGVLDGNALAQDRSAWPCLAALPPEVVNANNWFVVDYRLPTDPHRQQGIARDMPQLPVSVGDHVEVFPGNCQQGELARIGAILAAELPDASVPEPVPAKTPAAGPAADAVPASAPTSDARPDPASVTGSVTESVSVPSLAPVSELGPVNSQGNATDSAARPIPPR